MNGKSHFLVYTFFFRFSPGIKKFEYCLPQKTPEHEKEESAMINKDLRSEAVELYGLNKSEDGNKPLMSPFAESKVYFATCSPRKNKIMKKRHYNVSPDGVSSLDEYTNSMTTITYETNTPGRRRMSITISDGNSSEVGSEPIVLGESLETSSLITQSTNCSRTTSSPLPSPSSSGRSMATTASCNSHKYQFNVPFAHANVSVFLSLSAVR
jgi:hypothetical protein